MIIKPSWRLELSLLLYPPGYSKANAPFYCLPKTTQRIMIVCLSHCLLKYTTVLRVRIGNQYIICPFYGNRELIMEIGFLFQIPPLYEGGRKNSKYKHELGIQQAIQLLTQPQKPQNMEIHLLSVRRNFCTGLGQFSEHPCNQTSGRTGYHQVSNPFQLIPLSFLWLKWF